MRKIKFKELASGEFSGFGQYKDLIDPEGFSMKGETFEFYRDIISLNLGTNNTASFSVTKAQNNKAGTAVALMEYHNFCCEAIMPLNGDIIVPFAPAMAPGTDPTPEIVAFRIPAGVMVVIEQGVWHGFPVLYKCNDVNILIGLPARTYANDCIVYQIPEDKQPEIELV